MPAHPVRHASRLLVAALILASIGCAIRIDTGARPGEVRTYRADRFLWGLIGSEVDVPAASIVRVDVIETALDRLLAWGTAGIYVPSTIRVWFARGEELSPRGREAAQAPGGRQDPG